MVSSVSSAPSVASSTGTSQVNAMDKVSQEQLYNPGLYAMQEVMPEYASKKKKHSFLGFLAKTALTAVVVGGAACLGRKKIGALKDIDLSAKPLKEAKIGEKIKYGIAKFGEWVDTKVVQKVVGFVKRKGKEVADAAKKEDAPAAEAPRSKKGSKKTKTQ